LLAQCPALAAPHDCVSTLMAFKRYLSKAGFPDPASFYTYSYSHNIFAPPPSIYATLEARHRAEGIDHSPRTAASKAQAVKASESNVASWLGEIASKVGEGIGNALQKQLDRAAHEAEELSSANNARREKQLKQPSLARWCADLERANTQVAAAHPLSLLLHEMESSAC